MTITIKRAKDSKRIDFTADGIAFHTNNDGFGIWEGDDYMKQIEGAAKTRRLHEKGNRKTFSYVKGTK